MTIYHVIIEKFGVMNIEAESAEEAEQIASDLESQGAFEMDIQISVEKAWEGGLENDPARTCAT